MAGKRKLGVPGVRASTRNKKGESEQQDPDAQASTKVDVSLEPAPKRRKTRKPVAKNITAGETSQPKRKKAAVNVDRNGKKIKFTNFRQSPYPEYSRPTREECFEVIDLLTKQHGEVGWKTPVPPPSRKKCGCGEVPEVVDAVCRTIISGHLDMKVADKVIDKSYDAFPLKNGTVDWNAVRKADAEDFIKVFKDARTGLFADKVKNIRATLNMIFEECKARREVILGGQTADLKPPPQPQDVSLENEDLTLEWLRASPAVDQFNHLYRYGGVGVKTAACILLFAFQQPVLAVDTHVLRLSQWLGWMPGKEVKKAKGCGSLAPADACFFHIDAKVPDELKYGVHQLFIMHGQTCVRCRGDTNPGSKGWAECVCPIEHLVNRVGKMKEEKPKKDGAKEKAAKKAKKEHGGGLTDLWNKATVKGNSKSEEKEDDVKEEEGGGEDGGEMEVEGEDEGAEDEEEEEEETE
ncbi:hypothetical protein MMC14_006095 [Varicellaria rhodocarpa]|nr:hypothetical protein [Varicellaria rhodocarpa]